MTYITPVCRLLCSNQMCFVPNGSFFFFFDIYTMQDNTKTLFQPIRFAAKSFSLHDINVKKHFVFLHVAFQERK